MTQISNQDVQNLYKLNSTETVKAPREDYANQKADPKTATWLTRKVISLREPTSRFGIVNKIGKLVAWVLSCLLFKSSKNFIAKREEILNFNFTDSDNCARLIKSIPELYALSPATSYKEYVEIDLNNPSHRYVNLFLNDKKPLASLNEVSTPTGKIWQLEDKVNNTCVTMIADGKLRRNKEKEFFFDRFASVVTRHIELASKAE